MKHKCSDCFPVIKLVVFLQKESETMGLDIWEQNSRSEYLVFGSADTCKCVKTSEKAGSFIVHHQMVYL